MSGLQLLDHLPVIFSEKLKNLISNITILKKNAAKTIAKVISFFITLILHQFFSNDISIEREIKNF